MGCVTNPCSEISMKERRGIDTEYDGEMHLRFSEDGNLKKVSFLHVDEAISFTEMREMVKAGDTAKCLETIQQKVQQKEPLPWTDQLTNRNIYRALRLIS